MKTIAEFTVAKCMSLEQGGGGQCVSRHISEYTRQLCHKPAVILQRSDDLLAVFRDVQNRLSASDEKNEALRAEL